MADFDRFDDLDVKADALEQSLGDAATMAATFDGELQRVRGALASTGQDIATLERGLSGGLKRAFDGVGYFGNALEDVFGQCRFLNGIALCFL